MTSNKSDEISKTDLNTQLTTLNDFSVDRIIFAKPLLCSIPDSDIKYYRIPVYVKNEDGSVGQLVIQTEKVFSFGVKAFVDPKTKKENGLNMSFVMWGKDGPSEAEKNWVEKYNEIAECCKQHLLKPEVKKAAKKPKLDENDLKSFNPMYYKKDENGDVIQGVAPILTTKLIKIKNNVRTSFFDENGKDIDYQSILETSCTSIGAIIIEGMFVGAKTINIQNKLNEAQIWPLNSSVKRLLPRPKPDEKLRIGKCITDKDDDEEPIKTKKVVEADEVEKPKKKAEKKKNEESEEHKNDIDDDEPIKKPAKKSPKKDDDEPDKVGDDDEEIKPKKKPVKKSPKKDDDEEEPKDDEEKPKKKKKKVEDDE